MEKRRRQILIIEDDEYSREALEYVLRAEGYDTVSAGEGREGFRLAGQLRPDVIVMDLQLPDVEGQRLIRAFRRKRQLRNTPLLVVTGFDAAATESGADLSLTKPVAFDDYLGAVQRLLAQKENPADQ